MKRKTPKEATYPDARIAELVRTLREAEAELQALTGGQLDAVGSQGDAPYLLRDAQEKLRVSEAAQRALAETQMGILNALPAHIALLDSHGVIMAVNEAWRRFASANVLQSSDFLVGQNYLGTCESAHGDCADEAQTVAAGIRQVLSGEVKEFGLEYPCHSPSEKRWFRVMVTPLSETPRTGAVVMHVNVTQRRLAEEAIRETEATQRRLVETLTIETRRLHESQAVGNVGSWETDLATLDVTWTDETYRIFEANPREFKVDHEGFLARVHPEDRERVDAAFLASIGEPGPFAIEHRLLFPDERIKFVEERWQIFSDASGKPVRAVGTCQDITRRRQAEQAVTMSEASLARAQRIARMGNWDWNIVTGELSWSMQVFELFGIDPSRATGTYEQFLDGVHPEDRERTHQAVMDSVEGRAPYNVEHRVLLPDGTVRVMHELGEVIRDAHGRPLNMIGTVQDITERKASERIHGVVTRVATAVSASTGTEFFEQLAENMAGALGAAAGMVAEILPSEPPSARTIAAIVDGKKIPNFDYAISAAPCVNVQANDEYVVADRVAALFPNASNLAGLGAHAHAYVGRRLTNAAGEKIGLIFVLFREPLKETAFITSTLRIFAARAASELERQRSDNQLRQQAALLDAAHDAIVVRDLDDRIRYWNKGAERLFGWAPNEVIGRQASGFLYGDLSEVQAAMQEVLKKDRWEGELHHASKDGGTILVQASWTLLRDADGRPTSVLAINTDLTEKKKLEAQFLRAQRMESIGTMAGGIAHDLNNVLAPILMSVDLLALTSTSEEDQKLLATLLSSAQRGANLVSQVLSFARGVEGQRIPVNVGYLIRDLVRVMRETFPKNLTIEFVPSADLWSVIGDPTQIHQVILNLCVNARDAMPHGGTLTIAADSIVLDNTYASMNMTASPGSYVVIKVEDSGTGIPPEVLERVFEPFFTTKETGKGTGLGLSTTAAIVKSHGGFINLYSEVGKGTKFKVYLPAEASQAASDEQAIEQTRLPRGKGELILVVDDEESIRSVARSTLERFGYSVMVAAHGAEAIAIYAQHHRAIAVILTDMAMPIMDGPTMIIALKSMNPDVRIIGTSGLTANGVNAKAVGAGVEHFIPKPYTADAILKTIRAVLDAE